MIGFYLDEHISYGVAKALRQRGYTVVMAVEVGMLQKNDDEEHLPYATQHQLVMVTFDHPFATRIQACEDFYALVCLSHKIEGATGTIVNLLDEFGQLFDETTDIGKVHWWS
jgi:predicted nuclease of predicted toxin-antitoxin system